MRSAYYSSRFFCTALAVLVALLPISTSAAPCSNPDGVEGEMVYNTTYKVAQFCNGTNWIGMGLNAAPSDNDTLASLGCSSGEIPKWNGSAWACADDGGDGVPAGSVAGAVQFRGASAVFAADDVNLVWDDTNKRLGIGTATPSESLEVTGAVYSNPDAFNAGNLYAADSSGNKRLLVGVSSVPVNSTIVQSAGGGISLRDALMNSRLFVAEAGNVGIGTTTPTAKLFVTGAVGLSSRLGNGDLTQTVISSQGAYFGWNEINGIGRTHFMNHRGTGAGGWQFDAYNTDGSYQATRLVIDGGGNVGIGTAAPDGSAVLDISSTTKGLLPPRMTTAQVNAIASPPDGLMAYDTDTDTIKLRANGAWVSLSGGSSGSTFTDTGTDSYTTDDIAIGQSSVPETSAALEVESTTKGFLPPRMTTAQRNAISNPVEGLIIYNTSMQQLQYHNGSAWTAIGAVDSPASTTPLVLSWGYSGAVGTLGNGVANATSAYITPVNSPPSNIVAAYGGGYEYGEQGVLCLRTSSNQIYCWGRGEMIGDGDATDELQPKLTATAHSWKSVAVGGNLSNCAINTSDEAYCWGRQDTNGLGNALNNSTNVPNPTGPVGGSGTTWLQLAVGGWYDGSNHRQFACGIRLGTSEVQCWGNNNEYQLGNGTTTNNYTTIPAAISGSHTFKFITAGNAFACGINASDKAFCWGRGNEGQQGDGAATDNTVPTAVAGNRSYSMLTAGERFVCGIELGTQHAYCWGQNDYGQIGNASSGVDIASPAAVIGAKQWKSLAAGRHYVCGIDNTDRIFCWGRGDQGAIGNGELLSVSVPTLIYGEYRFAYVAAGATSMVAVTK